MQAYYAYFFHFLSSLLFKVIHLSLPFVFRRAFPPPHFYCLSEMSVPWWFNSSNTTALGQGQTDPRIPRVVVHKRLCGLFLF